MFADPELRRTLWSLVAFPKLKRQLLLMDPIGMAPKDFTENTLFWINQDFAIIKNGRIQRRGKVSLIPVMIFYKLGNQSFLRLCNSDFYYRAKVYI